MRNLFICVTVLLLASCVNPVTRESNDAQVKSFIGTSEEDLVRRLGVPKDAYVVNNKKFITYSNTRSMLTGGGVVRTTGCRATFEIVGNVVVDAQMAGNGCGV